MTPPGTLKTVFLLQRAEGWSNVRSVWRHMVEDSRFQPTVWVLPHDVRQPDEITRRRTQATDVLESEKVPFAVWQASADFDLKQFHVAVFTTPYDTERPSPLHFDVVARQVPVTIYVPYGFVVGGGRKNHRLQYAQPTQIHATLVFARSRRERGMYGRYCPSGDAHVHVTGLPRLDDVDGTGGGGIDPGLQAALGGRFAVLWNSHFTLGGRHVGSLDFSTFDRMAAGLFRFAANNPEVALIWRPHPQLLRALVEGGMLGPADVPKLERELAQAGIVLDRRTDHRPAFAASDALITDAGSFLIEYLMTGKPMAYLRNPTGPGLTEEAQELVSHLDEGCDAAGAISFIERARIDDGSMRARAAKLRDTFLPMQDGGAARRILECIATSATSSGAGAISVPPDLAPYPTIASLVSALEQGRDVRRTHYGDTLRGTFGRFGREASEEIVEGVKRRPALFRALRKLRRPW